MEECVTCLFITFYLLIYDNMQIEEGFSEDPYLSGELSYSVVTGMQSVNVAATVKHFLGYAQPEQGLNTGPVHAGERELRTTYVIVSLSQSGQLTWCFQMDAGLQASNCGCRGLGYYGRLSFVSATAPMDAR